MFGDYNASSVGSLIWSMISLFWAYYAEGQNLITKGEFGPFEACIARLRKEGLLNPDVVPDDKSRETLCVESVDDETPERFAAGWLNFVTSHMSRYAPVSIWDGLDYYVEVAVEKKDLLQIYEPICTPLGIPLSNLKGWSDVNTRRHMLKRMRDNYNEGRLTILLYIGDFDPKGLLISDALKSNLMDCENTRTDAARDAGMSKTIGKTAQARLGGERAERSLQRCSQLRNDTLAKLE